jgi:hypothetical protein
MTRSLVVEREVAARMAGFHDALATGQEAQRYRRRRDIIRCRLRVGRLQRVAPESVLDVGKQQLLVLLLMLQAQFDQHAQCGVVVACQPFAHGVVDATAVVAHFVQRGAGQQAALRAGVHRPHGLVVGVEQVMPFRPRRAIGRIAAQHELLEEPGGVRKVPFAGTGVRHRLDLHVLGAESGAQVLRMPTHVQEAGGGVIRQRLKHGHVHRVHSTCGPLLRFALQQTWGSVTITIPCRTGCSDRVIHARRGTACRIANAPSPTR